MPLDQGLRSIWPKTFGRALHTRPLPSSFGAGPLDLSYQLFSFHKIRFIFMETRGEDLSLDPSMKSV